MAPQRRIRFISLGSTEYHSSGKLDILQNSNEILVCTPCIILTSQTYFSAEDEDYLPPGSPPPAKGTARLTRSTRPTTYNASEEDIPLSYRRKELTEQRKPSHATSPSSNPSDVISRSNRKSDHSRVDLPVEVLHNILLQACKNGAIPTAPNAACVSKAWRAAVKSCPSLWTNVDLSYGWCRPTNAILTEQCQVWTEMRSLNLSACGTISENGLRSIADACPRLERLNLSHCTGMREPGLADVLCTMLLRPASDNASPLRDLDLSFIQITPKGSGLDAVLRRVLLEQANNPNGPVLQRLIVEGCPMLSHRPLKTVYDASLKAGRPLLGALHTLSLAGSAGACGRFQLNLPRLQLATPNMRSVDFSNVSRALGWELTLSVSGLPEGAAEKAGWPHLRICHITRPCQSWAMFDMSILEQMISKSGGLEDLSFSKFGEVYWDELAAALPEPSFSNTPPPALSRALEVSERCEPNGVGKGDTVDQAKRSSMASNLAPQSSRVGGIKRLTMDGVSAAFDHQMLEAPSLCQLFSLCPWLQESLEELSVVGMGPAFDDGVCELLAGFPKLRVLDAKETSLTDKGLRCLLKSAKRRGVLRSFQLDITSCRGVERSVRQAGSRGMQQLLQALIL